MLQKSLLRFAYSLFFVFIMACAPAVFAADVVLTPEQGKSMVDSNKDIVILDVRNPNEFVVANYPGAINIPVKDLEERYSEVPAGKTVLIHCAKGLRAERAYAIIKEKRPDITEVFFIKGDPIFPSN